MTDCRRYTEMISAMMDGELSANDVLRLRAHMETCSDCRRVYDAFAAISGALGDELAEPPESLVKGTMFKINMQQGKGTHKRRFSFGRFTAIAACFAIIVFGVSRFGLLDGFKKTADSGQAESYSAPEAGETGGDLDLDIKIDVPGEVTLPEWGDVTGKQPEESKSPATENDPGASLFGNGSEFLEDPLAQEAEQLKTGISKLFETSGIKVYQGKYAPAAENAAQTVPFYTVSDSETGKKLAELLLPETLLKEKPEGLTDENTMLTILIPADKTMNSQAKDVLLTVWKLEGKLICQREGETPTLFSVKTTASELEEFFRKLAA